MLLRAEAGRFLCERWQVEPPVPSEMLGALQTLPLPFPTDGTRGTADALNRHLWETHRVEAMFMPFGGRSGCGSAQIHNRIEDYERLASVLGS